MAMICGKCARAERLGFDDGQIPKHFRTCPKRPWYQKVRDRIKYGRGGVSQ